MSEETRYRTKLEKLEPVLGSQVNSLMSALHQGSSIQDRLRAAGLIDLLYQKHCLPDLADPRVVLRPPSSIGDSELTLGDAEYRGKPVSRMSLTLKDLTRHVGIWGTTGSGKTNLAHILIDQLRTCRIPFTMFDWKQNFRSLAGGVRDETVLYYTVGSPVSPFFWNPLEPPPNTDWEDWLKLLIEAMKHAFFLGHGVERILQRAFFDLAGDPSEGSIPTFRQTLGHLESQKVFGREAMWLDSAKRTLGALSFGGISRVFNVPISVGPILDRPVAYGLETLTDSEKTFFTEALCLWTYFARLNQKGPRRPLEHVFIMEEAHNVLTRAKQTLEDRESLMDGILRQVRELGEGFVIIDQQPSSLTNSALANINTHFAFNLHNAPDIRAICDCIGLDGDDRDYLKVLQPGEAIAKLNGIPRPFQVRVPESTRNGQRVLDPELSRQMLTPSVRLVCGKAQSILDEAVLVLRHLAEDPRRSRQNTQKQLPTDELSDIQREFLESVAEYPHLATVERYERLGLTAYMGDKLKEQLIQKQLITQHDVSTPQGRVSLLQATPAGLVALGRTNVQDSPLLGGPSHEYWKHKIAQALIRKGWQVEQELRRPSGQFDLVIRRGNVQRAIEVETGSGNIGRTIEKLQGSEFDTGIIAATDSSAERKIAAILSRFALRERHKIILTKAPDMCL